MKRYLTLGSILLLFSLLLVACGGDDTSSGGGGGEVADVPAETHAGDAAAGEDEYDATCIACHGPGGEGVQGLGKSFVTSDFVNNISDDDLLDFIKVGRPTGDPDNTTGVDMPPKGGNPALTDDQLVDIIAYIRTLNE